MLKKISTFLKDEEGATAIEYGLIAGLIVVLIIGALELIGPGLQTVFGNVATAVGKAAR